VKLFYAEETSKEGNKSEVHLGEKKLDEIGHPLIPYF
jgi:hypothetical protein